MVSSSISTRKLEQVIAFHGHLCPGLTIGIRVAEIALREIGPRAQGQEIAAVADAHSCAVDAIQYLVGCTVGKGNLMVLDHGRQAFTFAGRSGGTTIRVVGRPGSWTDLDPGEDALFQRVRLGQASESERSALQAAWRKRALAVLEAEERDLFDIQVLRESALADGAGLSSSIPRDVCSERTTASLALHLHGKSLSPPCPETALASRIAMRPIGIVHNELGPYRSPPRAHSDWSTITVHAEYADGLLALGSCEKLHILFCFDRALAKKVPLHQHPMGDRGLPVRGVFALRSPHRPNPIGLTTVTLLRVEGNVLTVSGLDAWDGTPVLDIKPFIGG